MDHKESPKRRRTESDAQERLSEALRSNILHNDSNSNESALVDFNFDSLAKEIELIEPATEEGSPQARLF